MGKDKPRYINYDGQEPAWQEHPVISGIVVSHKRRQRVLRVVSATGKALKTILGDVGFNSTPQYTAIPPESSTDQGED